MCGITGFIDYNHILNNKEKIISSMMNSINHRGPDSQGYWICSEGNLALGHLRLSIIDTSNAGHQPMHSSTGIYVVSYNGEIYNYLEIRNELEQIGRSFNSNTDTEVLLVAIEEWGIEKSLEKFEGMFAFAIYNKKSKELYLVRDRIGEKPLYYGLQNNIFFFSSELKAINHLPNFKKIISEKAVNNFLHYSYFPGEDTIYKNVKKLEPGSFIKINTSRISESLESSIVHKKYWKLIKKNNLNSYQNLDHAVDDLEILLKKTIKNQMISDVPLGAFLSGGIDSSLIVALMQENTNKKIQTFSIGFQDEQFDESKYASKIAKYIGTEHNELILDNKNLIKLAANIVDVNDQPFGDISSIPTKLVSNFAKSKVTVSLSGDAGDELFCGYDRYSVYDKFYNIPFRHVLSYIIKFLPPEKIEQIMSSIPNKYTRYVNARRILKFGHMLQHKKNSKLNYHSLFMSAVNIDQQKITKFEKDIIDDLDLEKNFDSSNGLRKFHHLEKIMNEDIINYLPDDILYKVDRAAMSESLETRIPFLNHKIVEFAQSLPIKFKYNRVHGKKIILKRLLSRKIPIELFDRPKKGFGAPIENWLRGPLREWMFDSLSTSELKKTNIFNEEVIAKILSNFMKNNSVQVQLLWNIIILQKWMISNNMSY